MRLAEMRSLLPVVVIVLMCCSTNLVQGQAVTTLAGGGSVGGTAYGNLDGTGVFATINSPQGLDCSGNYLYIADTLNLLIRKMDATSHDVTTIAGGSTETGHVDDFGVAAMFIRMKALLASGNFLYIADQTYIRMMDLSTAEVTTLAGSSTSGLLDGNGIDATLREVRSFAISGNFLYFADVQRIRMLDLDTLDVTTIAGAAYGHADGVGTDATMSYPRGFSISGNVLYFVDRGNNNVRMMDLTTNEVTTVAGGGAVGGTSPGYVDGTGLTALFSSPSCASLAGNTLYIADSGNNLIRAMDITTYAVTTFAGGGSSGGTVSGFVDDTGVAALFNGPSATAVGPGGLYVSDTLNYLIRLVTIPTAAPTTTANPTTADPTTAEPSTADPTTGQPTTGNPTTGNPTTGHPTTGNPTTGNPTTGNPTTGNPTTGNPTTGYPTLAPSVVAVNATIVIPLPAGVDLSSSDLQALYSALVADAGSSLSVSMPAIAYDATTNLPYIVFVVTKTGSGSLSSALQATSFSSAKAVLQQKGVPFSQVALCIACSGTTPCNVSTAHTSCRASLLSPTGDRCPDGCIAGLVVGLVAFSCIVGALVVFKQRQVLKDAVAPAHVP